MKTTETNKKGEKVNVTWWFRNINEELKANWAIWDLDGEGEDYSEWIGQVESWIVDPELSNEITNVYQIEIENKNEIPRRARVDLYTPAELAIRNAVLEVEKIGADVKLTEAVILLGKAKNLVADFVDSSPVQSKG